MARFPLPATAVTLALILVDASLAQEPLPTVLSISPRARFEESPRRLNRKPAGKGEAVWQVKRDWQIHLVEVRNGPPVFLLENVSRIQDPEKEARETVVVDDGFDPAPPSWPKTSVALPEAFFERYFFGEVSQFELWRDKMDRLAETQLRLAEKVSKLSGDEERKLRLAAKGDIKHLADELEFARDRVEEASVDLQTLQVLLKNYQPLRLKALSGPFRPGSLFQKTLEGIRRKQREGTAEMPSASLLRGFLAALDIAFLKTPEPPPPNPKTLRELIDDASRLPVVRHADDNARLRDRIEQRNLDRQRFVDIQLAMPSQKPPEIHPLTAIDDFERDNTPPVEVIEDVMPEGFFDRYFLGVPRDSSAFISRNRRFLVTQLKQRETVLGLSAADKKKLRLAAQGDLKRLDDELAAARNRLEQAWANPQARMLVLASLEDLKTRARSNPHQSNSLVWKTLNGIARRNAERDPSAGH